MIINDPKDLVGHEVVSYFESATIPFSRAKIIDVTENTVTLCDSESKEVTTHDLDTFLTIVK